MDSHRLARLTPNELSEEQLGLYNEIAGGRRSVGPQRFALVADDGALEGPFGAMLLSPSVGHALQALGASIRYASSLSTFIREAIILMVAAKWDCSFERMAHEPLALDAGLTEADIAIVRDGGQPLTADPHSEISLSTAKLLIDHGDLTDEEYSRAVSVLDTSELFEISTLFGYYSTLALQLRLFRV